LPRTKSWEKFYRQNWLVVLYSRSKNPIYAPPIDRETGLVRNDPANLHREYKTEKDWFLREPTNDMVLNCWQNFGYNVGCLTGTQRNGRLLTVKDFDVKKIGLSKDDGRAWRRERIALLKGWNTRVVLTPSGGFHAWFWGDSDRAHAFVRRMSREQNVDWLALTDMTRGAGGMVVVPPSSFYRERDYFFLEEYAEIRDVSEEPVPLSPLRPDPVEDFLSGLDLRRKA